MALERRTWVVGAAGLCATAACFAPWYGRADAGVSLSIGLTRATVCVLDACAHEALPRSTYRLLANGTFGSGLLLALVLLGVAGLFAAGGALPAILGKLLRWGLPAWGIAGIVTWVSGYQQGYGVPLGLLLALAAVVLGFVGMAEALLGDGPFGGGRHVLIRSTAVAPTPAPRPAPAGSPVDRARLEQRSHELRVAAAVRPGGAGVASRVAGTAGMDVALASLRFVAASGAITADGLAVELARGGPRTIRWSEIERAVARRLPPDPPYEKVLFVDLVAGGVPIRLLPSSLIDWRGLPDGAAGNNRDNLRRLLALARTHHPAIELDPEAFFLGKADAPAFAGFRLFAEYDRRYG